MCCNLLFVLDFSLVGNLTFGNFTATPFMIFFELIDVTDLWGDPGAMAGWEVSHVRP